MSEVLWVVGTIVVLGAMIVIAFRMEPHWASKDGRRFICRAQLLTERFEPVGRWREVRGQIGEGIVAIRPRSPLVRSLAGHWEIHASGETDRRKRRTFMLRREDGRILAIRMPASSRAAAAIDEQLER